MPVKGIRRSSTVKPAPSRNHNTKTKVRVGANGTGFTDRVVLDTDIPWYRLALFALLSVAIASLFSLLSLLVPYMLLNSHANSAQTDLDKFSLDILTPFGTSVSRLCLPNLVPRLASDID